MERIQFEECLDERVLHDVGGVLGGPDDVNEGVVQPVLISDDQLTECGRVARAGVRNQLAVFNHNLFRCFRRREQPESSTLWLPRAAEIPAGRICTFDCRCRNVVVSNIFQGRPSASFAASKPRRL